MKFNSCLLKIFLWVAAFYSYNVYSQNITLTSLSPVRNGQSISEATNVTHNFSIPINVTSVNNINFSINSLLTGKKTGTLSGGETNSIVFDPTVNFKPGEVINATVKNSIQGTGGQTMSKFHSYTFRVAAGVGPGVFVPNSYFALTNPRYLTSTDFNGDGFIDFATAQYSTLNIYLNNGAGIFIASSPITIGQSLTNICSGDFDGDGDVDIMMSDDFTTNGLANVYVRYNNGTGVFSSGATVQVWGHPISMAAADFNGDSRTDVALCYSGSYNISILTQQGTAAMAHTGGGYLLYQGSYPYNPTSFCAADFDNDGDIDLGAATSQGRFFILSNIPGSGFQTMGMFTPTSAYASGSYQAVSSADFDNDGLMDMAVSTWNETFILKGNGLGSITQVASFNTGGSSSSGLTTADVEGDGDIDVIVANGQTISIIKNNGGTFSLTTASTLSVTANGIASADIDGDGDMDILAAGSSGISVIKNCLLPGAAGAITGSSSISRGQTGVTYSTPSISLATSYIWNYTGEGATITNNGNSISINFSSTATSGLLTVKGNNSCGTGVVSANFPITVNYPYVSSVIPSNGSPSVISTSNFLVNFSEAMNSGTASTSAISVFGSLTGKKAGVYSGGGSSAITFDPSVNFLPGELIYTSVNYNAKNLSNASIGKSFSTVFTSKSSVGPFAFGPKTPFASVGTNPRVICTADFNGDLKPDLAWANYSSASINISFNNGSGSFSGTTTVSVGTNPTGLGASDFDGDGDMDLAVANRGANTISILTNNAGTFSVGSTITVGSAPQDLAVSDLDGDGDFDIVVANYTSNNISIVENNLGVFSVRTTLTAGTNPSAVTAMDFDNDGDADIAAANYSSNSVTIFQYQGLWNYVQTQTLTISNPTGIYGNDLDGDGDIDLAISSYNANAIYIRKNDGLANFSGGNYVYVGYIPYSVKGGDFDGDGDIDLVVANNASSSISVSKNNGTGAFANNVDVAVGTSPYSICVADFDNDGDLDAVTANYGSSNITPIFNCDLPLKGTIAGTQNVNQGQSYIYTVSGTGTATSYSWEYTGTGASFSSNPSSTNSVTITFNSTATPGSIRVKGTNNCGDGPYSNNYVLTFPLPTLISVSPLAHSSNVNVNTNVVATFSQAMSNATASSNAIKINRTFTGVKPSLFSGGTTSVITADPSINFKPGEKVQTSITTASQNLTNLNLATPYVFDFTTAAGTGPCQFHSSNVGVGIGTDYSTLADFNGDGHIDIATIGYNGSGSVAVISTNNGKGVFSNLPGIAVDASPSHICSGDFDGDGDVDFATTSFATPDGLSRLTVKYNNGTGGINGSQSIIIMPYPTCTVTSDFNGDGRTDVICGFANDATLNIFKSNGSALSPTTAASNVTYQGTSYIFKSLSSIDFDKDGDIDLAAINGSGLVLILSNDGTGFFSPLTAIQVNSFSSVNSYQAIAVGDFNADGRSDIVVTINDKVAIIKNNSNNTLSILYEATLSSSSNRSPTAGDMDGDGDIDIVLTGGNVTLVKNNGAGSFTVSTISSVNNSAKGIAVADLDGDNDLDIVSSISSGNYLSVLFNNLPPTISAVSNQTTCANQTKNVSFTVGDVQTPLQDLVITKLSSNTTLIPLANLTVTGTGAARTLSIIPVAGLSGTGIITLTVADHNNAIASVTFTIIVNPLPTITASANPASICPNSSTSLSASGGISYLWFPATGLNYDNIYNPILTLATPGNYSYQVTGTDANGCVKTNAVTITVNALPVQGTISPSQPICYGEDLSIGLSGALGTVLWEESSDNFTFTPFVGESSSTHLYKGMVTTTKYYRARVHIGACTTYTSVHTASVIPLPTVGTITANQTICSGNSTTVSLTGGAFGWIDWYRSIDGATYNYVSSGSTTLNTGVLTSPKYYYKAVVGDQCTDVVSPICTLTVTPPVSVTIHTYATNPVCQSDDVEFYATYTNAGTDPVFNWHINDVPFFDHNDNIYIPNIQSTSVVTCEMVSNATTCLAGNPVTSIPVAVTVNSLPISGTISSNQTICSGSSTTITLTGSSGTVSWQQSTDGVNFTFLGVSGTTLNTGVLTATRHYRAFIANSCSDAASGVCTITVNACKGLTFDGLDDRAIIPNNSAYNFGTGNFTLEAWVKFGTTQVGFTSPILSNRTSYSNGILFTPYKGTQLLLQLNDVPNLLSQSFNSIFDNTCHHVAVTRAAGVVTFYLDGVAIGTALRNVSLNSSNPWWLGSDNIDNRSMNGNINEIRIWNVARTASQISTNLSTVFSNPTSNLIGYYRIIESSGQSITDGSSLANHGFLGSNSTASDANDPVRSAISCHSADRVAFSEIDSNLWVNDTAGVSLNSRNEVHIYPNPTTEDFTVLINGEEKEYDAVIINLEGKVIYRRRIRSGEEDKIGEDLPAGMYILQLASDDEVKSYKLMKQQ